MLLVTKQIMELFSEQNESNKDRQLQNTWNITLCLQKELIKVPPAATSAGITFRNLEKLETRLWQLVYGNLFILTALVCGNI